MSALARYFLHEGKQVAGYDRTASELTRALECEGATVTYEDEADTIPEPFRDKADTLVVYTPAIPSDSLQFGFFRDGGFEIVKRSRMLGVMAEGKYLMYDGRVVRSRGRGRRQRFSRRDFQEFR